MKVTAEIQGKQIERDAVLAWEDGRFGPAAKKLGVAAPLGNDVAERREAFLATKLALGPDEIRRRLARNIKASDLISRATAALGTRRRFSVTDIHVEGAEAGEFASWFQAASLNPDQAPMLRANPDHFIICPGPSGQDVLETTGGSPLATFFTVDYDDHSGVQTPADPDFPFQIAGVAHASNGTPIGGVRHQLRDTPTGYQARLTVEFPLLTPGRLVADHRWHLACEFSNWAEAAAAAGPMA
jgi:hypothetical protein